MLGQLVELEPERAHQAQAAIDRMRRHATHDDVIAQLEHLLIGKHIGAQQLGFRGALAQQVDQYRLQVVALQLQRCTGMLARQPFEVTLVDQRDDLGDAAARLMGMEMARRVALAQMKLHFHKSNGPIDGL